MVLYVFDCCTHVHAIMIHFKLLNNISKLPNNYGSSKQSLFSRFAKTIRTILAIMKPLSTTRISICICNQHCSVVFNLKKHVTNPKEILQPLNCFYQQNFIFKLKMIVYHTGEIPFIGTASNQ